MTSLSLTISFCTRNRETDLRRAVDSVLAQAAAARDLSIEMMIVDDGALPAPTIDRYLADATAAGWRFTYRNKRERGGLFRSRLETVQHAAGDVILFFDDDVIVEPGYLAGVADHFSRDSSLAGLGGVDLLCPLAPAWRRAYEYLILYRSLSPGLLSLTGYGGSMDRWLEATRPFDANYLYGCNMAFRRHVLIDLQDPGIFAGHATGEDLYLAAMALRKGLVQVDPKLKVSHYQSPIARDRMDQVFFRQVANHFRILEATGSQSWRRWLVVYTAGGIVLLAGLRCLGDLMRGRTDQLPRLSGGLKGLWFVVGRLLSPSRS